MQACSHTCSRCVLLLLLLCIAGRSIGLSAASLVVGIMLGAALNAWLRVDIVPLGVSAAAACSSRSGVQQQQQQRRPNAWHGSWRTP